MKSRHLEMSRLQSKAGSSLALPAVNRARQSSTSAAAVVAPFRKEAKPLEHGAVAELIAIFDQLLIVAVCAFEVHIEAIRDMLNAAAERRVVEHVDDCPVNIGDRHLGVVTPDWLCAEDFFGLQVLRV